MAVFKSSCLKGGDYYFKKVSEVDAVRGIKNLKGYKFRQPAPASPQNSMSTPISRTPEGGMRK